MNLTQAYVDYNSGTLPVRDNNKQKPIKQKQTETAPQVVLHTINTFESRDTNSGESDFTTLKTDKWHAIDAKQNDFETKLLVPLEELCMNEISELNPQINPSNDSYEEKWEEDDIFYSSLDEGYEEEEIGELSSTILQTHEMEQIPYNMLKLDQHNVAEMEENQEERRNVQIKPKIQMERYRWPKLYDI